MIPDEEPAASGEGSLLAGRYRLEAFVGQGGMSFVYAATDELAKRRVAVKLLRRKYLDHAEIVERFLREAQAAARIVHPNVVEILDYGTAADGQVFTAMEFLLGESLASTSAREGALPWARVRHLALQLCAATGAAHAAGIVHRDVSLANAFRIRRERDLDFVKLVDFGLARVLDSAGDLAVPRLTSDVEVFGTPAFMAPEQVRRSSDADPRSDVYSLGVVMFALSTGRLPFAGRSAMQVLDQQLHDAPPRPGRLVAGLPDAAEAVILQALEKDPAQRFATMAALADAITAVPSDAVGARSVRPSPGPRRWPLALGALVVLVALWLAFL